MNSDVKNKIELLAPAGNFEKLEVALRYGADAVYIGGENFSLRNRADNFNRETLKKAVNYVHNENKRIYVTLNIYAHNDDLEPIQEYLKYLASSGVDALIVSDPGVIAMAKEIAPNMELHLSTQANTTNWQSAKFWHKIGIQRFVLARELSYAEIREFRRYCQAELEVFVHGAMCMAYSGRCLLSNFMTERDANRGDCAQSCRWEYAVMEKKERDESYFPVEEDGRGTYIFNSKDLNLLRQLSLLIDMGINSFKIEGRMKSIFYLATVVRAYRQVIDAHLNGKLTESLVSKLEDELTWISHRSYTTGFFEGKRKGAQNLDSASYLRKSDFLGQIIGDRPHDTKVCVMVRSKFSVGDEISLMGTDQNYKFRISEIWDETEMPIMETKPNTKVYLSVPERYENGDILHRIR